MKLESMVQTGVAALLSLGISAVLQAAPVAEVVSADGKVLVNRSGKYVPMAGKMALHPGNRLLVLDKSSAVLIYKDGCILPLGPSSLLTVGGKTQCTAISRGDEVASDMLIVGQGDAGYFLPTGKLTEPVCRKMLEQSKLPSTVNDEIFQKNLVICRRAMQEGFKRIPTAIEKTASTAASRAATAPAAIAAPPPAAAATAAAPAATTVPEASAVAGTAAAAATTVPEAAAVAGTAAVGASGATAGGIGTAIATTVGLGTGLPAATLIGGAAVITGTTATVVLSSKGGGGNEQISPE